MNTVTIETPFNIDLEFRVATPGRRMLAWLIDVVLICIYYYVMLRFIYPLLGMGQAVSTAASLFLIILPVLSYQLVFELFFNGQTVGKMLVGIKVMDKEGKQPTWGQYITRWFLCLGNLFIYTVPYVLFGNIGVLVAMTMLYMPDFFCMLVAKKNQRIGDLAAGTVVIDKNYVADIQQTIYLQVEHDEYKPMFPQVMKLSDKDINGLKNLLNNRNPSKSTLRYTAEVIARLKQFLQIETDLHPQDLVEQLLRDYNYYTNQQRDAGKSNN